MSYTMTGGGLAQYQKVGVHDEIESASPHRLIQMLMEGALGKIFAAKACMENSKITEKGENISMAISIVSGLRASLNNEAGGEIAENMNNLYDYMERRLLEANIKNDIAILDEVISLLSEIKSAWDTIPTDAEQLQAV